MIPLRVWVVQMRGADPEDSRANLRAPGRCVAKLLPVVEPATADHVVYRRQRPVGMIQMTMQHTANSLSIARHCGLRCGRAEFIERFLQFIRNFFGVAAFDLASFHHINQAALLQQRDRRR